MTADGWTPVLSADGTVYCSPKCGCGCTKAAYDAAMREADTLAKGLGVGWEPVVWENGGWHYQARKGVVRVAHHTGNGAPYSAWIEPGRTQFIEYAETAEDALGFAMQAARTYSAHLTDALNAVLADRSAP